MYPRSFADSDGDGVGDLDGLTARLDYLKQLGVDAIWLNPVIVSPMADHGYDVADPRDVDPLFGGLARFRAADRRGARARASRSRWTWCPTTPAPRTRGFRRRWPPARAAQHAIAISSATAAGPDGVLPPNNWESVFGGPAWTRVIEPDGNPGQWYLHLFDAEQPDLNWDNPEVFDDFEKTLRFWLERGVDGFRIDVAHGMAKPPGLPDTPDPTSRCLRHTDDDPRFNHPGVHDDPPRYPRGRRRLSRSGDRSARSGFSTTRAGPSICVPTNCTSGFNFRLTRAEFDAADIRDAMRQFAWRRRRCRTPRPTWTLSNHDVGREVSRYGDGVIGLRRARAMAMLMLALPGAVFIYNGEELGLPDVESARRGAAGPDVGTLRAHRARPRSVPGADALVGRPAPVRVLDQHRHLAADARGLGGASTVEKQRRRSRFDLLVLPPRHRIAQAAFRIRRYRHRVAVRAAWRADLPSPQRLGMRAERGPPPDQAAARRAALRQHRGGGGSVATRQRGLAGLASAIAGRSGRSGEQYGARSLISGVWRHTRGQWSEPAPPELRRSEGYWMRASRPKRLPGLTQLLLRATWAGNGDRYRATLTSVFFSSI